MCIVLCAYKRVTNKKINSLNYGAYLNCLAN